MRPSGQTKLGFFPPSDWRSNPSQLPRRWLDATGTTIAVQQKMMRHTDIRTTMNIYGDVVTDEMTTASSKVAQLVLQVNGAQTERNEG